MSELELVKFIGESVIENWKYILSSVFALISCAVALSWFISSSLHKKEIKLLQLELSHQKERFHQFEIITDKRMLMLQSEAEILSKSMTHEKSDKIPNQNNSTSEEVVYMDIPAFLRRGDECNLSVSAEKAEYEIDVNNLASLIARTDAIKTIIKSATAAF